MRFLCGVDHEHKADQSNSSDPTHEMSALSLRGGGSLQLTDHASHDYERASVGPWMASITDEVGIVVYCSMWRNSKLQA
jgi:hypothetical protein